MYGFFFAPFWRMERDCMSQPSSFSLWAVLAALLGLFPPIRRRKRPRTAWVIVTRKDPDELARMLRDANQEFLDDVAKGGAK